MNPPDCTPKDCTVTDRATCEHCYPLECDDTGITYGKCLLVKRGRVKDKTCFDERKK
jgi:hypothetical protein